MAGILASCGWLRVRDEKSLVNIERRRFHVGHCYDEEAGHVGRGLAEVITQAGLVIPPWAMRLMSQSEE